ncbi:MAG TPA: hypothetical protein DCW90_04650, partial [Lachnospiraceae bacterium]|nr:hypothetical protein [Lachnospiraceae bacterium]
MFFSFQYDICPIYFGKDKIKFFIGGAIMYNLLSLLAGVAIAILVTLNGQLSSAHGVFVSAVIIHIAGIIFAILLLLILRKKFTLKSTCPAWAYLGGVI